MKLFAKNNAARIHRLIHEPWGAERPANAAVARGLATMEAEGSLEARICKLDWRVRQRAGETTNLKKEISEEVQRRDRERRAKKILLDAKEKQMRRSNTRNKRRVYSP